MDVEVVKGVNVWVILLLLIWFLLRYVHVYKYLQAIKQEHII